MTCEKNAPLLGHVSELIDAMQVGRLGRGPGGRGVLVAEERGGYARDVALVLVDLGEALDSERLGDPEESGQSVLVDAHLAAVHEVQEALHVRVRHVLQYDDRVLVRVTHEQGLQFST